MNSLVKKTKLKNPKNFNISSLPTTKENIKPSSQSAKKSKEKKVKILKSTIGSIKIKKQKKSSYK